MDDELPEEDAFITDSGALMSVVREMLDGYEYRYQSLSEQSVGFALRNSHGLYNYCFTVDEARDYVRLLGTYGPHVPVDRRVPVAEALSRINTRIAIGNFELDFDDGEVRFRVSLDIEGGLLVPKMVDNMLGFTIFNMERFHDALMRIAFGDADPELAIVDVP